MSFFTGKNVLVTGAAGLIGHATTERLLSEGAYVRATKYTTREINLVHPKLEVIKCDLTNKMDCDTVVKDMDIVINSVAYVRGAGGQAIDPTLLVRNNIFSMVNMIDASVRAKNHIFVSLGSSTMYPPVLYPVKEEEGFDGDPYKSYEGIGWVKRYCEKLCMHYHKITSTKFAMVRTTAVYGPNDNFHPDRSHVIPDLIMKAHRKENPFYVWGDGTQIRDFIYVDDFIEGMLLTIENHPNADPINIATGMPTSVKQLVSIITEKSGYNPEFQYDASKPTAIPYRLVSTEKAKKILGWSAPTSLNDGITKTIEWYRNNLAA